MNELWQEYFPFISKQLKIRYNSHRLYLFSIELNDLIDEFYLYFIKAVNSYNPELGDLKPRLIFYMKNCIRNLKKKNKLIKYSLLSNRIEKIQKNYPFSTQDVLSLNNIQGIDILNLIQDNYNLENKISNKKMLFDIDEFIFTQKKEFQIIYFNYLKEKRYTLDELSTIIFKSKSETKKYKNKLKNSIKKYLQDQQYTKELCYN